MCFKMFNIIFLLPLFVNVVKTELISQNGTCPVVKPRELDIYKVDGKWYFATAAMEMKMDSKCAMVTFSHKNSNTTDLTISWIVNNTFTNSYKGSVILTAASTNDTGDLLSVTYTDNKTRSYTFLDVNYEHYAVVFACFNDTNSNGITYELWTLSRTPHIKEDSVAKINKALAKYNLTNIPVVYFNSTSDTCQTSGGHYTNPTSIILFMVIISPLIRMFSF